MYKRLPEVLEYIEMQHHMMSLTMTSIDDHARKFQYMTAYRARKNSTRALFFTSALDCMASENFDISSEN